MNFANKTIDHYMIDRNYDKGVAIEDYSIIHA
jgi:hypothetical protein